MTHANSQCRKKRNASGSSSGMCRLSVVDSSHGRLRAASKKGALWVRRLFGKVQVADFSSAPTLTTTAGCPSILESVSVSVALWGRIARAPHSVMDGFVISGFFPSSCGLTPSVVGSEALV